MSRAPQSRGSGPTRLAGGLLVVATLLAYGHTLPAPFVYDDVLAIPGNPTLRQLWPLADVLLPPADGGLTVSGRPILNLSFALNYAVSGTAVWSYHVFNILVHAAAGLLLFGIVRRTLAFPANTFRVTASASEWTILSAAPIASDPAGSPAGASVTPNRAAGASADATRAVAPKAGAGFPRPLAGARRHWPELAKPRETSLAFAIALLWTLHPLQTQAVTYTVQRAESLTGFFYLLTLYAFVRAAQCHLLNDTFAAATSGERGTDCHLMDDRRPAAGGWLGVSAGACLLGMGTKEIMATAPLVVLLFDRTFGAGTFRAAWRARRGYYLGLATTWLLLAALVASTGGNRGGTAGLGVGVPLWAYPLTQFEAIARYLALALWPHPLIFEYGTFWVKDAADVLPPAAIVLPLLGATAVALRRWPAAGFLGATFFLLLAPTSLTPGTIQMIVEHRMYLPLAVVLASAVLWADRVLPPRALAATTAAMALALGIVTARRNHDYRSHLALWSDTVAKRPDNPRAHEGLAEAWSEIGRPDLAAHHRAESIRLRPDESTYHYNLGLTRMEAGQWPEAWRSFQHALRLAPNEPRTHNNLAIVLGRLGRTEEALAHYAEAVRLKSGEAQYQYNFGVALARAGRSEDAVRRFRETLRLRPDHADAHFNLGVTHVRLKEWDKARGEFEAVLRLEPENVEARANLERVRAAIEQ